jgi:hypothetical protein
VSETTLLRRARGAVPEESAPISTDPDGAKIMSDIKSRTGERRSRSPNDTQRERQTYYVRDLDPRTESKIKTLSSLLNAQQVRVIDKAVDLLFETLKADQISKCQTSSSPLESLPTWLLNRTPPPGDDPKLQELEAKLAERRRRRDEIMGRR